MSEPVPPTTTDRKTTRRVKSGCTTCKARKVKCDESRPSCRRCITAGRVCGGYGIWGGGGSTSSSSPESGVSSTKLPDSINLPDDTLSLTRSPYLIRIEGVTQVDGEHYEWFKLKTSTKLSGAFLSDFWTKVVFQATADQPAIMHAVLALSSIQRMDMYDGYNIQKQLDAPDEREQYALGHYIKAMNHIRQHATAQDRKCHRVALIACILFASLELFRGRSQSARTHLQGGVSLWTESRPKISCPLSPEDYSIVETLYRIHALTNLFNRELKTLASDYIPSEALPLHTFDSIEHARRHLDILLLSIRKLANLAEQQSPHLSPTLFSQQSQIRSSLQSWLLLTNRSTPAFHREAPFRAIVALRLLAMYHALATLQNETIFTALASEQVYDAHDAQFHFLVSQSLSLFRKMGPGTLAALSAHGAHNDSVAFLDVAWLPACYFVAIKCRVRAIRLAAWKILNRSEHRESAWDSRVMARVARRVIEIEEESWGAVSFDDGDDGPMDDLAEDIVVADQDRLPQRYRVRNVEFVRPEGPTARVVLSYWVAKSDGHGWELRIENGDLVTGTWTSEGVVEQELPIRTPALLPKSTRCH